MTRVAAVLTCHNRRAKTLACLEAVTAQEGPADVELYVVDDGSTDGTADAVRAAFPAAHVIRGDGTLYWNGGMRVGLAAAYETRPDHCLWLNDDTTLDPDALRTLVAAHGELVERGVAAPMVVGSVRDPDSGALTYGGVVRPNPRRPMQFRHVEPGAEPRRCDTMNGNCVLVPAQVFRRVGNLDPAFVHAMGDYDYGLRAGLRGCSVWIAPGTIGTCRRNPEPGPETLAQTWKRITGRKGLPFDEWRTFTARWAGPWWPVFFVSPYARRMLAALRPR